ncbi:hypothetical protein ABT57_03340 [Photobacterium ganghwense]|uniref:Uncharacterized protein n=1 Tax=Photobacterium ganghwense TaxID=320778 RepID=A0A0J1HH63_9GAMM|nr:hypothetical protein ABT57_03340 [Photobacterium ganghwense]
MFLLRLKQVQRQAQPVLQPLALPLQQQVLQLQHQQVLQPVQRVQLLLLLAVSLLQLLPLVRLLLLVLLLLLIQATITTIRHLSLQLKVNALISALTFVVYRITALCCGYFSLISVKFSRCLTLLNC